MDAILAGISYEQFVKDFVNKRNPANNMYWKLSDIAVATETPMIIIEGYLLRAQNYNYVYLIAHGKRPTEGDLLAAPLLDLEYARQHLTHSPDEEAPRIPGVTI